MTKPKLILSDIDGTLLTDDAEILPATVTGVKQAVAQGATMVLASARSPKGMFGLAQQLRITSTMIAYNGALTAKMTATSLTVLEEQPIASAVAAKVERLVRENWPQASFNIYAFQSCTMCCNWASSSSGNSPTRRVQSWLTLCSKRCQCASRRCMPGASKRSVA